MEKVEGPKERTKSDHLVKFIALGEKGVGKTSLHNRYIEGRFQDNNLVSTIGVSLKSKIIKMKVGPNEEEKEVKI